MTSRVADRRAGHDRWLMSYADLVTLLFACFTVLYAASTVRPTAGGATAAPTDRGVAPSTQETSTVNSGAHASVNAGVDVDVDRLRTQISGALLADVQRDLADVSRDERGVVVSLPEAATFAQGSAEVSAEAKPVIARLVNTLVGNDYAIRVEGHTDDTPMRTTRYQSNWELSTARAAAVVAFMIDALGVPPDTLSAAGYGQFHPRASNASAEGRARNRRIEIVVLARRPLAEAQP
jgi:chemotaxis protein MotB